MINGPTLLCTHILPTKKEILLQTSNSQWYYMSQSLQLNEKLLMMQYGCYLSIHSLYGTCRVVADLATIKHSKIC